MSRRRALAVLLCVLAGSFVLASQTAANPVRLARHPDYHAGKIVFSYLGDIWTANEDGSNVHRITDNTGRDVYPRFSPDGRWIAFSSNRYGNYDVFVVAAAGGAPRRLTFHTGNDEVVGWTRDSQHVVFRAARGDGAFPTRRDALPDAGRRRPGEAAAGRLGLLGQLLARRQVARLQPPSRRRGRASTTAAATRPTSGSADLARRPTRSCSPTSATTATGRCGARTTRSTSWPIRCRTSRNVKPGSPDGAQERQQHLQDPGAGRAAGAGDEAHRRQPVLALDVERRQGHRLRGQLRHLEARRRLRHARTEIKIDIATDEKENELEIETVTNEVDAFDISPSGRRAVISARGQILTIATERGDITRIAPDKMASRNDSPKWSPDGKLHRVRLRSVRPRRGLDQRSRRQDAEEDHRSRQREGRARLDARFEGAPLHRRRQEALQLLGRRRQDRGRRVERRRAASAPCRVSPDSKWIAFSKQDRTLRSHVYIAPIAGGEERHISDDSAAVRREQRGVDGRRPLPRVHVHGGDVSSGVASQGGLHARRWQLWALSLRDQDRDPMNRDIDNEAQGLAAEAAARQAGARRGGGAAAAAQPAEVRIDWSGLARRARQLTVPGTTIGGLDAGARGARGRGDASSSPVLGGGRGGPRGRSQRAACTSSTSRAASSTRVPPRAARRREGGGAAAAAAPAAASAAARHGVRARRPHAVLPVGQRPLRGADSGRGRRGGAGRRPAARRRARRPRRRARRRSRRRRARRRQRRRRGR